MGRLFPAVVVAGVLLAACGLDQKGSGGADSDAGPLDAGVVDAPADVGVDAPPEAGARDGGIDAALLYSCPGGASASDCASCPSRPIHCAFCKSGAPMVGLCTPTGQTCLQSAPSGYSDCRCGGDVSTCPLPESVCVLGYCSTCGAGDSDRLACRAGGTCTASSRTCQ